MWSNSTKKIFSRNPTELLLHSIQFCPKLGKTFYAFSGISLSGGAPCRFEKRARKKTFLFRQSYSPSSPLTSAEEGKDPLGWKKSEASNALHNRRSFYTYAAGFLFIFFLSLSLCFLPGAFLGNWIGEGSSLPPPPKAPRPLLSLLQLSLSPSLSLISRRHRLTDGGRWAEEDADAAKLFSENRHFLPLSPSRIRSNAIGGRGLLESVPCTHPLHSIYTLYV